MQKQEPLTESYFYILLCLSAGPNHGYGIMQMTSELSEGKVQIGSGTMYGATNNLMKRGWIREAAGTAPDARGKRLYQLTEPGLEVLLSEVARLRTLVDHANQILNQEENPLSPKELDLPSENQEDNQN